MWLETITSIATEQCSIDGDFTTNLHRQSTSNICPFILFQGQKYIINLNSHFTSLEYIEGVYDDIRVV